MATKNHVSIPSVCARAGRGIGGSRRWDMMPVAVEYTFLFLLPAFAIAGKERAWLGPTSFITGAPSARQALGLAATAGRLYVHGGQGPSGAAPRIVLQLRRSFEQHSRAQHRKSTVLRLLSGCLAGPRTHEQDAISCTPALSPADLISNG
jgi:hypothetical protein